MKSKLLFYLFFCGLISLVFFCSLISLASASAVSTPIFPAVYHGYITSPCDLSDAKLKAYMDQEPKGEVSLEKLSESLYSYGSPALTDKKLVISGNRTQNNTSKIKFYLEKEGKEILLGEEMFISGRIEEKNFTLTAEMCSLLERENVAEAPSGGGVGAEEGGISVTPVQETPKKNETISKKEEEIKPNVTEKIIKIVQEEGLEKMLGEKIEQGKIEEISVKEVKPPAEIISEKKDVESVEKDTEVRKKLGEILQQKHFTLKPLKMKNIKVKLIRVKEKDKEVEYTKIEKRVDVKRVIEMIPKSIARSASEIHWIKGDAKVLKEDPVFFVAPENSEISYIVEGNVSQFVGQSKTIEVEIKEPKEMPKEKQKSKYGLFIIPCVVILCILLALYALKKHKR